MKALSVHLPALFLLPLLAACASSSGAGRETRSRAFPPATSGEYGKALARWTRTATVYRKLETKFAFGATLKSPDFRRAYVKEYGRRFLLDEKEIGKMLAEEEREGTEFTDILLSFSTPDSGGSNLASPRNRWRFKIVDGAGTGHLPLSIRKMKGDFIAIRELLPFVTPWAKVYVVRFPGGLHPGSGPLTFIVAGDGVVAEVSWNP